MESVDKDLTLRQILVVKPDIKSVDYKCIKKTDYNYTIKHSFMFDFKLGEYLLSPLISLFSTIDGFDYNYIIDKIKTKSQSYITKLPNNYFPNVWYNYENKVFKENEKRPYICNENPKYR